MILKKTINNIISVGATDGKCWSASTLRSNKFLNIGKLLGIIILSLLLSEKVFAKEVEIICFNDTDKEYFIFVKIEKSKKIFYWDNLLYKIIKQKKIMFRDKGSITGLRNGELITINPHSYKARIQRGNIYSYFSCRKDDKLF